MAAAPSPTAAAGSDSDDDWGRGGKGGKGKGGKSGKGGKKKGGTKATPPPAAKQPPGSAAGKGSRGADATSAATSALSVSAIAAWILEWQPAMEDSGDIWQLRHLVRKPQSSAHATKDVWSLSGDITIRTTTDHAPSGNMLSGKLARELAERLRPAAVAEYDAAVSAVFAAGAEARRRAREAAGVALRDAFTRLQLLAHGAEVTAALLLVIRGHDGRFLHSYAFPDGGVAIHLQAWPPMAMLPTCSCRPRIQHVPTVSQHSDFKAMATKARD